MDDELKELLGITNADLLMYLAYGLVMGSFWVQDTIIAVFLSVAAISIGIVSINMGSQPDENFSPFTNFMKRYSYHFFFFILIVILVVRFGKDYI